MGRPLSKRFFGNRNYGSASTTADDGIGGSRVGSVTIDTAGTYTSSLPTVTFSDPDLSVVGAVTALGTVHGKALSAVATVAGSGYAYGDTLYEDVVAGNDGTYATWTVSALKTVTVGVQAGGGGANHDNGDRIQFSGTYNGGTWTTPLIVTITSNTAGVATGVSIYQAGVWSGAAAPTTTAGSTRTQVYGAMDTNATGLVLDLTAYGVSAVTVATEGDYTAITSGAKATTAAPAGGTGATLTITYGVKSIAIDEPGSGYTNAADAGVSFSSGSAAGTVVLETDATDANSQQTVYAIGSNENAIKVFANIDGSEGLGEIITQKGSRRYRVHTAAGTGVCNLTTDVPPATGFMTIYAYDSAGNTYTVTKLTRHLATVTQYSGSSFEFNTDDNIPWTFDAATLNTTVKINNS